MRKKIDKLRICTVDMIKEAFGTSARQEFYLIINTETIV